MNSNSRPRRRSLSLAVAISILAACATARAAADEVEISRDALVAFQHYQTLEQPQFFALSADGIRYGYSYCPEGLCPRLTPARQLALDACQDAGGRSCRIVAAGKQPDGTFSPFGKLTKDPLADELFRIMRRSRARRSAIGRVASVDDCRDDRPPSARRARLFGNARQMGRRPRDGQPADGAGDGVAAVWRSGLHDRRRLGSQTPCIACTGSGSGSPLYATGKTDFSARKAVERQMPAATPKGCLTIEATCSEGVVRAMSEFGA